MTSPNLTCETCYFWLHQPAVWADRGLCRVHAPTVTPQATGRIAEARWPHTERTDWCGEYKGAGS